MKKNCIPNLTPDHALRKLTASYRIVRFSLNSIRNPLRGAASLVTTRLVLVRR